MGGTRIPSSYSDWSRNKWNWFTDYMGGEFLEDWNEDKWRQAEGAWQDITDNYKNYISEYNNQVDTINELSGGEGGYAKKEINRDWTKTDNWQAMSGEVENLQAAIKDTLSPAITKWQKKADALKAEQDQAYAPSQGITDIEAQIQERLDNPETISDESVQKWIDWQNNLSEENDRRAAQRISEQFSSIGDFGSSAHRRAIQEQETSFASQRGATGIGLAQSQLDTKNQTITDALNRLMGIEEYKGQQRLIPLQQKWQEHMSMVGQAGQQKLLTQSQNFESTQWDKNLKAMQDLYASIPQPKWYEPLLNAGLGAVGTALGGPIAGLFTGGMGNLFGSSQQGQANPLTSALSLYNNTKSQATNQNNSLLQLTSLGYGR